MPPTALLLDLGRVLLDVDFERCFVHWADSARRRGQSVDVSALRERFSPDERFEAHERGELPCPEFFRGVARSLGLALDVEAMRSGWNAIFGPEIPGVRDRLQALATRMPVHVLSNTNLTHAAHFRARAADLLAPVDTLFVSHELGMRKPEPRIYDAVAQRLGLVPEAILFLDDDEANLAGAQARGLRTRHVPGPQHTCGILDAILAATAAEDSARQNVGTES